MSTNAQPNVVLPLVATLNERGTAGYTNQARDQHKINSMYEVATNPQGESALYLVNRPGVTEEATAFLASPTVSYLISLEPDALNTAMTRHWLFYREGTSVKAADTGAEVTIATATGLIPVYVDMTSVSGVENIVVQIRNPAVAPSGMTAYFRAGPTLGAFTQISDADFTGLSHTGKMEFMDGFAFQGTIDNRIYNSNINSLANWTAGNFITKQIRQDLSYGLGKFGQQILFWGAETMEVFRNAGNELSPLESVPQLFKTVGLVKPDSTARNVTNVVSHYYATLENRLYFVGRTAPSGGIRIFTYDGNTVEPISDPFISNIITERGVWGIWPFSVGGYKAIAVSVADPTETPEWYIFFPEQKTWFKWTSTKFHPINSGAKFLGHGADNNHAYYFDNDTENYFDDGDTVTMTHQFKLPSNGNHLKSMHEFGVIGDTPASAHALNVSFSDNGGTTFSTARPINMTDLKKEITRCGMYRDRVVKLTSAVNQQIRLEKVLARVS